MSQTFKIVNSANTSIGTNVNYYQLPLFQRYVALQIGDYKLSTISQDINGWLVCDGRSIAIADYPELYAVIGNSFGNVDGEHFNLPNYTSRVIGMYGEHTGNFSMTAYSMGEDIGVETVTLTTLQLPSHNHTGTTDTGGIHTHTHNANGGAGTSGNPATGLAYSNSFNTGNSVDTTDGELNLYTTPIALSINNSSSHTHTFTTANTGSGNPSNNNQLSSEHKFLYFQLLLTFIHSHLLCIKHLYKVF